MKFLSQAAAVYALQDCYMPLDVMFLQDTTGSFIEDLPNVARIIPDMVAEMQGNFPGSHFGVAEFKDKPYKPMGETNDYCYRLHGGRLSSSVDDFLNAYSRLWASGGSDLPEAT